MTVGELIRELEGFDQDKEVRLAQQPQWPFEYEIGEVGEWDPEDEYEIFPEFSEPGVLERVTQVGYEVCDQDREIVFSAETREECERWVRERIEDEKDGACVYIGEAAQLGYLPSGARRALGWTS
jgi:hypothetical protein